MNIGIRNRIRRLGWSDRLLLVLTGAWTILAILANYYRVSGVVSLLEVMLWAAIAGGIAYSVMRQRRRLAAYGFSFKRGGLVSLAIVALLHVYLLASHKFVLSTTESCLLKALGAFMEEIVFRVVAIDSFILLMNEIRAKAFWAILASAVLWFIPHTVSKSLGQLPGGIFLGGLCFGYIYYKSRSILLPAWIHSVANAGHVGGVLTVVLYCVIGAADCAIGSRNTRTSQPAVAPPGA